MSILCYFIILTHWLSNAESEFKWSTSFKATFFFSFQRIPNYQALFIIKCIRCVFYFYFFYIGRSKQRVSSSSPESTKYSIGRCCERTPPLSDEDAQETLGFLKYETVCPVVEMCSTNHHHQHQQHNIDPCCCRNDRNGQM